MIDATWRHVSSEPVCAPDGCVLIRWKGFCSVTDGEFTHDYAWSCDLIEGETEPLPGDFEPFERLCRGAFPLTKARWLFEQGRGPRPVSRFDNPLPPNILDLGPQP